jgi:thiol:disulfide interchange protein
MLLSISGLMTISIYVSLQTLPTLSESPDGRLKFSNVILFFTGILTGLVLTAALVYVLPGQFTFWPTAQ